jgi:hypothetical protein
MTERLSVHPAEFWEAATTIQKLFKRKTCIAGRRGDCEGRIVEAHTIPRSQLEKIAVNGHVYDFRGTPGDLYRNQGLFSVDKRGIGQFSVLNFFCSEHDRAIFSHLENDELIFDDHQLALLHYRAMGAELYKKVNALNLSDFLIERLKGRRDRGVPAKLEMTQSLRAGQLLGLRDMSKAFGRCEEILVKEKYTEIHAAIIYFKSMPSIMTVGGFSPEFDYDGRRLQKLGRADKEYHQVGLSILVSQGRAAVVFTWLREANVCERFVESFLTKDPSLFTTLVIQTAFEHLENTCMNIEWWDGLRSVERTILLRRMQFAGSPTEERMASCLGYCGITFDQWDFESFKVVRMNRPVVS